MCDHFEIPVIDFAKFSLDNKEEDVCREDMEVLADQICNALKTVGFLYLKNHGIAESKFEEIQKLATKFFTLPAEAKQLYARSNAGLASNHGWISVGAERNNPDRPPDMKEAYNVSPRKAQSWPDEHVPGFKALTVDMYKTCATLANRIHYLLGIGLKLKDPELFRNNHNAMGPDSSAAARILYYPLTPDSEYKPGQIRCGEHTDYGTMTLLMQDEVGGLEVMNKQGSFVPARPIPGTIVVNVGDLLQRWTSDQFLSNTHRVVQPTAQIGHHKPRVSFAYFVQPDSNCLVRCIDGSEKYQPILAGEFVNMRIAGTEY